MVLIIRPHILWMQIIKTDHQDNLDPLDHLYQEDRYRICIAYFVFVEFFRMYFLYVLFSSPFWTLVHQTKERNIAKGKAARELSSA